MTTKVLSSTLSNTIGTVTATPLYLQSNNTTAITVDASQNVGVGVTPSAWTNTKAFDISTYSSISQDTVTDANLSLAWNAYANGYLSWKYKNTGDKAVRYSQNNTGSHVWYNAPSGTAGNAITWTQAMTLDNSGNLLVGYTTSNGSYKLQVNSQIFATSSTIATSDAKYKTNVKPLENALTLVNKLNPVSFNWKQHPIHAFDTNNTTVGFLAQEVQSALSDTSYVNSVVKESVCTITPEVKDEDGNVTTPAVTEPFLGIAEGNMISILTKAIQELSAQVTTLQSDNAALKAKVGI